MKELEETNCEVKKVVNFLLPEWEPAEKQELYDDEAIEDGSKTSNQTQGNFLSGDCRYAWLSQENRLAVVDMHNGSCISHWNFPSRVASVAPFPAQPGDVPLLLIGLDNNAIRIKDSIGHLIIFQCCTQTILHTIELPAGVEKACIIHGGEEWEEFHEKRPDTILAGNTGLIFVALRNLQHIVIDLNRPIWENSYPYQKAITAKLEFVNTSPNATTKSRKREESSHSAYNLLDKEMEQYIGFDRNEYEATPLYDESLCSVLLSSTKIGCLITGCLGRTIIWQNDGSIGWISPLFDENAYVTHFALLEPSDDPRPFYYLWVACQSDSSSSAPVLRMYAMFFNKKQYDKSGEECLYYNLESDPSLKFELELEPGERIHSLLPVERENPRDTADCPSRRGEDNLLLIGTNERLLMFDLNRWYKEQMPRTMSECRNPNSVMASYRTVDEDEPPRKDVVTCAYVLRSLREFPTRGSSSPEELFFPNSISFEWLELAQEYVTTWSSRGVQSELLREITMAGPMVLVKPTETFRRCLSAGLVPFDSIPQDLNLIVEKSQQREMLLTLCLEQRWTSFLIRCATEWSDGSAAYLYPEFLRWGVQRASEIKLIADKLCVPLFDQSGTNIGESEVKILRFCAQQFECLGTVVSHLPNLESDLDKQRRALRRLATYLNVLLWFHDVGLLPETQELEEEGDMPQISVSMKIPYPKAKLEAYYQQKRENQKDVEAKGEEVLFIEQLITRECFPLREQWENEAGTENPNKGGHYPPPSLQSLLRSFLIQCFHEDQDISDDAWERGMGEIYIKHCITIYVLMDLAMLLQNTFSGVDRLIKYPSAFKLSPSLIKLTQAFWLLDHDDFEGFFNIITGQLILNTDIKDWHHKLAINTLLRNDQHKMALIYLRTMKPPLSSLEDQGTLISLTVEQGFVETAFHSRPPSHYAQLLTRFFIACKANGKLKNILQLSLDTEEEEAFVKFLKEGGSEEARLLYYLQRCRHIEAGDVFNLNSGLQSRRSTVTKKVDPVALKLLEAYNGTLPQVTKNFATTFSKIYQPSIFARPDQPVESRPYPRPMSHYSNRGKNIYELSLNKARETCLRVDKVPGASNHVPFLVPPCSTIVYCTRVVGSNIVDHTEATTVTYAKKVGKRTLDMIDEDLENREDYEVERKRRRLGTGDSQVSKGHSDAQSFRRLSMSQVCNTPLVQRKVDGRADVHETPHSILKIRQLIKRNSSSPGFALGNSFAGDDQMKCLAAGDGKSSRQIRFSMDRSSNNEDSNLSMNETNQDAEDQASNKSASSRATAEESNAEEVFFSPNASVKSVREGSVLSDSSFTKCVFGPRARPSLRRSSGTNSCTSTEYLSNKTNSSSNTTLSMSNSNTLFGRETSSPPKFSVSPSIHSASILSPNTSFESSPLKRAFPFNNKFDETKASTESEELSDEDEKSVRFKNVTVDDDDSTADLPQVEEAENEDHLMRESGNDDESMDVDIQDQEEDQLGLIASVQSNASQEDEISEDEEPSLSERNNFSKTKEAELEETEETEDKDFENANQSGEFEQNEKLNEIEEQDDTFQSIENFVENELEQSSHLKHLEEHLDESIANILAKDDRKLNSFGVFSFSQNHSLRENSNQCGFDQSNYSLTKPIFIDNRGIMKLSESVGDITDDESLDAIQVPDVESQAEDENDLTLNVSTSEGSDAEKVNLEKQAKNVLMLQEKNKLERESTSIVSNLLETTTSSGLVVSQETESMSKKDTIPNSQTRLSTQSAKSEDLGYSSSPLRKSSRTQSLVKIATPRRPIKSMSVSPVAKVNEPVISSIKGKRSTSVTKEDNLASTLVKESDFPNLCDINAPSSPRRKSCDSRESDKSLTPRRSRTPSKRSSREPSQDNTLSAKNSPRSPQKNETQSESLELTSEGLEKPVKMRTKRTGSVSKTKVEKSVRKARATPVTQKSMTNEISIVIERIEDATNKSSVKERSERAASVAKDTPTSVSSKPDQMEVTTEENKESKKSRSTRASSQAKETSLRSTTRKTRAGSVALEEQNHEFEETLNSDKPKSRSTRASSQAKDTSVKIPPATRKTRVGSVGVEEDQSNDKIASKRTTASSVSNTGETQEDKPARRTRAGSVSKTNDTATEIKPVAKRTRAGSVVKEDDPLEDKPVLRRTRAGSVAKEEKAIEDDSRKISSRAPSVPKNAEHDDILSKRPTRKRGNSVPKEIISLETSRPQSRNRRSTSLLKEVILEESLSQLESPAPNRARRVSDITLTSSPAANTRARRSSIQSMPEDLEEVLHVPVLKKLVEPKEDARSRRAMSVDSNVIVPAGKRLTRSVLAKASILEEVIPEEATPAKKQPTRRKRATSVTVDDQTDKEEEKPKATIKAKRGRKASESKDFQFSLPEEAEGDALIEAGEGCRTPTFKFSEPTGLQKFISPIPDEEPPEMTTKLIGRVKTNSENTSSRFQRRPRTHFMLPKITKDKAK